MLLASQPPGTSVSSYETVHGKHSGTRILSSDHLLSPGPQENQDKGGPGEDELSQVLLTHIKTLQKSPLIYI